MESLNSNPLPGPIIYQAKSFTYNVPYPECSIVRGTCVGNI